MVQWGDLKKTKWVPAELKDKDVPLFVEKSELINKLELFRFSAHDIIEKYEQSKPSRLPKGFFDPVKEARKDDNNDDNDDRDLVCIGVKLGVFVVGYTHVKDRDFDLDEINAAKDLFTKQIPEELLFFSGKPELHIITDDCGCCS